MIDCFRGTTICLVRRNADDICIAGDGQQTRNETISSSDQVKVYKVYNGTVLIGSSGGFAASTTLREFFCSKLNEDGGDLSKTISDLSKSLRYNKDMQIPEATLLTADRENIYMINGAGECATYSNIATIGSGRDYAYAAAVALYNNTYLSADDIAKEAMHIAASMCVYTNENITYIKL